MRCFPLHKLRFDSIRPERGGDPKGGTGVEGMQKSVFSQVCRNKAQHASTALDDAALSHRRRFRIHFMDKIPSRHKHLNLGMMLGETLPWRHSSIPIRHFEHRNFLHYAEIVEKFEATPRGESRVDQSGVTLRVMLCVSMAALYMLRCTRCDDTLYTRFFVCTRL